MSNLPRASDDDSEDSDVAAAIRMSLADMNGKSKDKAPMIDLTSDNEQPERNIHDDTTASESESDEDLKAAIKLSMKTATQASHEQRDIENYRLPGDSTTASESEGEEAALEKEIRKQPLSAKDQTGSVVRPASNEGQTSDPQDTQSVFARLGLDRKKLEEERLARQRAKRKASASVSPPPVSRQSKTRKVDEGLGTAKNVAEESTPKGSTSQPHLQFPHGVVKKTWAFGQPRMGDDIKIEEVLQKETLQVAVLSSFIWDYDWIFPKIAVNRTRLVLIHHAKYPEQRANLESDFEGLPSVRLCFPYMDGQINCMHSKLMLLFHDDYLRIVVPTANLTGADWGEGGVMENMVFLIDLPKKERPGSSLDKTSFEDDLLYFLKEQGLHDDVIRRVGHFDFIETRYLAFVHSVGGNNDGDTWRRTGHPGLGRAIAGLGLGQKGSALPRMDAVASSIGSLTLEFLQSLYSVALGDDGLDAYTCRTKKRLSPLLRGSSWSRNFRVYFPTLKTVKDSRGGPNAAGTVCIRKSYWQSSKFPKANMYDCKSQRPGMLMHSKAWFVRLAETTIKPAFARARADGTAASSEQPKCKAWAYIGSANISESAWGRLVEDRTTEKPRLNCRNWECGVVVPVIGVRQPAMSTLSNHAENASGPGAAYENELLDSFRGVVPVPMKIPDRSYEVGTGNPNNEPWFFMDDYE